MKGGYVWEAPVLTGGKFVWLIGGGIGWGDV